MKLDGNPGLLQSNVVNQRVVHVVHVVILVLQQKRRRRLTADMLLLEAKIKHRRNDFKSALVLLKKAQEILVGSVSADIKTPSVATKYYNIA